MEPIIQIVITKNEQPVDSPQGEQYKVVSFCKSGVQDCWWFWEIEEAIACVRGEMEDLVSP